MREHRLAIATALATFVLLIVGSLVHGTGSSLACPDWPLCYGTAFPKMENGVQFENTHRLVAAAVTFMTFVLAVMLLFPRARGWRAVIAAAAFLVVFGFVAWTVGPVKVLYVTTGLLAAILLLRRVRGLRALGVAAPLLILIQALLGGITVLYKLPRAISIAHLTMSMCFFSLTIVIAMRTAPSLPRVPAFSGLRRSIVIGWSVVLAQMVLGAVVRHTASGLACLDVPLCHGCVWPELGPERVQM